MDLLRPPAPLTPAHRLVIVMMTVVTAASRWWGVARSPWDWDEILFSLALRHYDVALHHPHPPGFPLYIAAAKFGTGLGLTAFHSLQAVNLVAGALLVPAMVFFGRELRLTVSTALAAALLLAFFPNVWFFGETAFSDVPSVVVAVYACGLLLRGCRSDGAFIGGAIALAWAGAMRPQNLVIGLIPVLIGVWYRVQARRYGVIAAGAIAGAVIVGSSFGAAAHESGGWSRYREALVVHQRYITSTDSFRNPNRPPLHHLLDDFFVRPYHAPLINTVITAFVLISLFFSIVRRRLPILVVVAAFGPFCLAAWLGLDHFSASRFSIGYAPMMAVLAADGVALATGQRQRLAWGLTAAIAALMLIWALPAVDRPRRSVSPPVRAVEWLRRHADPGSSVIYVHESMGPYTEDLLPGYRVIWTLEGPPRARLDPAPGWYLSEGVSDAPGAVIFQWRHDRLWNLARHRYFDVSVVPLRGRALFGEGWYDLEQTAAGPWRWMGKLGRIELPPIAGPARLRLRMFVPLNVTTGSPEVRVLVDGRLVAAVRPRSALIELEHDFPARAGVRRLQLEVDQVVNPSRLHRSDDGRDLGLRLDRLEWISLPPS